MAQSKYAIVFVHGLFSSASTWHFFDQLLTADPALQHFEPLHFEYSTPKFRWNPLKRIPDYNVIADNFRTYLEIEASEYPGLIFVSHSQGGLVIQRYLARMLGDGLGQDLKRIRRIIMFSCPNSGSEIFMIVRRGVWFWKNPQERALRPINEAVSDAQQVVLNRVVHAIRVSTDQCPIQIVAYAGETDNVVTPTSAKGVFPKTGVIPGDHFSIIQPDSVKHRAYTTLKANLLAALASPTVPAESKRTVDSQVQLEAVPNPSATKAKDKGDRVAGSPINVDGRDVPNSVREASQTGSGGGQVVARWNSDLQTVEFILSQEVALSWMREFGGEQKEDE